MGGLRPVTILGLGNILLGDEGAGVRVVERIAELYDLPEDVSAIDGGTMGLDLLPYLKDGGALLIIDALRAGAVPGTVTKIEGDEVPAFFQTKLSPHQIGIGDLLATASLLDIRPSKTVIFGIEPSDLSTGIDLSPAVAGRVNEVAVMVADELRAMGADVRVRAERKA